MSADGLAIIPMSFYLSTEALLGSLRHVAPAPLIEFSMLQSSYPDVSPLLSSYVFDISVSSFIASFTLAVESHYWPTRVAMWLFLTDSSSYPVKRSRQVNLRPRQSILPRCAHFPIVSCSNQNQHGEICTCQPHILFCTGYHLKP